MTRPRKRPAKRTRRTVRVAPRRRRVVRIPTLAEVPISASGWGRGALPIMAFKDDDRDNPRWHAWLAFKHRGEPLLASDPWIASLLRDGWQTLAAFEHRRRERFLRSEPALP